MGNRIVAKGAEVKVFTSARTIRQGDLPGTLLWHGDVADFLDALPNAKVFDLVVTSPPYNIGKPYERPQELEDYIAWQEGIIDKALARLKPTGSVCWQVGNHVEKGPNGRQSAILPLDVLFFDVFRKRGLKLRNRIIWHFGHGLHCKHRFSGRYEVVLWFTASDDYFFDLDAVRIEPKYPAKKYFKGARAGQYSCNPKGKNPEDVWEISPGDLTIWDTPVWKIPNVKSNHVEKTIHPCQFPVALVDRLVLSLSPEDGLVFDPFAGVASAGVAALLHNRRFWGCELDGAYIDIARRRLEETGDGKARFRPFARPIYDHTKSNLSRKPNRCVV